MTPTHIGKGCFALFLVGIFAVIALTTGGNSITASEPVLNTPETGLHMTDPITYTLNILHTNDTWGYTDPCG